MKKDKQRTLEFIETLYSDTKYYNRETLTKKYHQIYRDSFFPRLRNVHNALVKIIKEVSQQLGIETIKLTGSSESLKIEDIFEVLKSTDDEENEVTKVSQLFGKPITSSKLSTAISEKNNDLHKGLNAIIQL